MQALSWQAFLEQDAQTPLSECFTVIGVTCAVFTNSEDILRAARNCFRNTAEPQPSPPLTMRLWVDPTARAGPPWPQPYFRGLSHLVYAGFDAENSLLLDLLQRRVIGRFSPSMARDEGHWQRVIFPTTVGLASESLDITALHCACVERNGSGLLLAGGDGAGKSTTSLAMAQSGFSLLSDDWTYFSSPNRQLLAWGLATPVKLLPDAVEHFPELRGSEASMSLNGEWAYQVDAEQVFGIQRLLCCEPHWLVFLERQSKPGCSLDEMSPQEAAARLEFDLEDLPPDLSQVREAQRKTILALVERKCWRLCHGESPNEIAQVLARFCSNPPQPARRRRWRAQGTSELPRKGPDLLRRFTPTLLLADLRMMNGVIRLETNSPAILQQALEAAAGQSPSVTAPRRFLWRLVSDARADSHLPSAVPSAISAHRLHLENVGQHNFFAVDAAARIAVGFVTEELVHDRGFVDLFLARMVSATAAALETGT